MFKSLLEHMNEAVYVRDRNMNIIYINPAAEKLTGWTLKDVPDIKSHEIFCEEIKEITCHNAYESKIRKKNGEIKEMEFSVSPFSENGMVKGSVVILNDLTDYKSVIATLKAKEEKYDKYINNAPDGIFVVDERGKFLEVNEAACKITGYSKDELLKMFIMDLVHPAGFKEALKHFASVRYKKKMNREIICKKKDGTKCYLAIEGIKISDDRYIGYCKDITQKKVLEDDLIKAREFLHNIINAVADPIFVKDENHKWVVLNDSFCKLMGYTREELIGKSDYNFFPEEEAKVFWEKDEMVFSSEKENENEEFFTDAGGITHTISTKKSVFTDKDGKKVLVGTIRDISERKKAEEERVRLATAIEQAAECVIITDADGYVQYVNPAFGHITGYTGEEILGKNIHIIGIEHKQITESLYIDINNTIKEGNIWTGNIINMKKNNGLYEVETSISPIRNKSGNIINYVCVARDVTTEKKMERHLRQSQKLEAIGTLAGGIAHDFNNILAIMMGYTELAMKDNPRGSITNKKLEGVLKAGDRAKDLVRQILTFSRQTEKESRPVRIGPIIKETLNFLRASLPSTIEIRKHIDAGSSMVMCDPTQIHQILMNLCTNAAYAMKGHGGILEINIKDIELEIEDIKYYSDLTPGSYVSLTVKDTGIGIDETIMERIFEPFFTTKKPGEGTGMGLSVVHGIIKNYGGAISVISEQGKGASFTVILPRISSGSIYEPEVLKAIPKGNGRIMFIDDEEELVYMEKQNLEELGYEVISVTNSIEALEIFQANPEKFDLIITDHTMPNMTGINVAKEITKVRSDIPVILSTGFGDLITEESIRGTGIKKVLTKPFKFREIAEVINIILDRQNSELPPLSEK